MPRQLTMKNDEVRDADTPERCPECGRELEVIDLRGDAKAYVHKDKRVKRECVV